MGNLLENYLLKDKVRMMKIGFNWLRIVFAGRVYENC
jgi:hypothetical protein